MAKLWLTERSYPLAAALIRIAYWLGAIYLAALYTQIEPRQSWFEIGLMAISLLFVIGFLGLTRILDHFFNTPKD